MKWQKHPKNKNRRRRNNNKKTIQQLKREKRKNIKCKNLFLSGSSVKRIENFDICFDTVLFHDLWLTKLRQGNESCKTQIKSYQKRVCVLGVWVSRQSIARKRYSREPWVVQRTSRDSSPELDLMWMM